MRRKIPWIAAAAGWLLLVGAVALYLALTTNPLPQPAHSLGVGPTIEQVRELASLVTVRVEVSDVVEVRAAGYVGSMKVVVLVGGDVLLGTDLTQARFEIVDGQIRHAVLILPQPQVTSPRLDHGRTRLYGVDTGGLWLLTPDDGARTTLINRAHACAQEVVARAGRDPALIAKARQHAEQVLSSFFKAQGWTLTIQWAD